MVDGESCCSSSVNAIETTKTRSFSAKAHTVVVTFANSPGHTRPLLASPVEFTVTSGGAVTVPLEVSSAMGEITGTVLINGVPPGTGFVVQFAIGSGYAMVSVQLGPTGGFHALLPVGCSQCCPPLLLPPPIVLMRQICMALFVPLATIGTLATNIRQIANHFYCLGSVWRLLTRLMHVCLYSHMHTCLHSVCIRHRHW